MKGGPAKDKILSPGSNYAYFMESAMIDYYVKRNCTLRKVGKLLDDKGYAIALPKGELELHAYVNCLFLVIQFSIAFTKNVFFCC